MSNRAEEEAKLIYIGATVPQLAQLFGLSQKVVNQRLLGNVMPSKPKGATEKDSVRYYVQDAAPYLCEAKVDIEEILKTITPAKLPPALSDVFWKGQKTRLEVETQLGNLWSTQRVVEVLAEAFKPVRMAIMMFKETVEQQEELTLAQRDLIDRMSDDLLESLRSALVEEFKDYVPAEDEHGPPLGLSTRIEAAPEPFDEFDEPTPASSRQHAG